MRCEWCSSTDSLAIAPAPERFTARRNSGIIKGRCAERQTDLLEQAVEQAESAIGHADERGHGFLFDQIVIAERNAGGAPALPQQLPDVRLGQRPEFVDESDARIKLRVACQPFPRPGMPISTRPMPP